jgi:hypothetical protein
MCIENAIFRPEKYASEGTSIGPDCSQLGTTWIDKPISPQTTITHVKTDSPNHPTGNKATWEFPNNCSEPDEPYPGRYGIKDQYFGYL